MADPFVTLPDGTVVVTTERGSARMSRLRSGVLLYVCTGFLPTTFYRPMVAVAQREIESSGSLVMIVDGWALASIETGFREAWTDWFKDHKQHFHMTLLVKSKLMEMAASLANLLTGIRVITTYSNVAEWERAAGRVVPGFRRSDSVTHEGFARRRSTG